MKRLLDFGKNVTLRVTIMQGTEKKIKYKNFKDKLSELIIIVITENILRVSMVKISISTLLQRCLAAFFIKI